MLQACPSIVRGQRIPRPVITLWWLVAVCVFFVVCPTTARAETLTAECRVFQRYMIDTSGLPVEFDYTLVAADSGAPMPEGASGTTYTWTFRRDDELVLKIPVDTTTMAEGKALYTYTLCPVTTELTDNLYYDTSSDRALVYTLEVYTFDESVFGKPRVQAIVRNPDGTKVADPGWYIYWRGADPKKPDTPTSNTNKSERDGSSNSAQGDGDSTQANGGTHAERTAQTGDDTLSGLIALSGGAALCCFMAAHKMRRYDKSKQGR